MYGRNANVQKELILYTAVIVQLIEKKPRKTSVSGVLQVCTNKP